MLRRCRFPYARRSLCISVAAASSSLLSPLPLYLTGRAPLHSCSSPSAFSSSSDNRNRTSSVPPSNVPMEDIPVYLKPSSSSRRKPSFHIPRMRDEGLKDPMLKADKLGTALPLFGILSPSCDYYALRLPLLKAGFKRVPGVPLDGIPSNLLWGKSMMVRPSSSSFTSLESASIRDDVSAGAPAALCVRNASGAVQKFRIVNGHQTFNHFPFSHQNLGCKVGMARNLMSTGRKVTEVLGSSVAVSKYGFVPETWFYPQDREKLVEVFKAAPAGSHFIWKPARGSCGRGICITNGGANAAHSWERVMADINARARDPEAGRLFRSFVVQRYLENPLLLDGRKMDLRLYVAVSSLDPLVVYLHDEGLVRLAAEAYGDGLTTADEEALAAQSRAEKCERRDSADTLEPPKGHSGKFRHLTNYSIGRKYRGYMESGKGRGDGEDEEQEEMKSGSTTTASSQSMDGDTGKAAASASSSSVATARRGLPIFGHRDPTEPPEMELKWSLGRLWAYLDREEAMRMGCMLLSGRRPSERLKEEIALLVVRTLMTAKPIMTAPPASDVPGKFFEVYGFDVMLDAHLQPHLIEVNTLPSLESSSTFDYATKSNVISDLLNLVMLEPFERDRAMLANVTSPQVHAPMSTHVRQCVNTLEEVSKAKRYKDTQQETREELGLLLKDQLRYARGFKRIFPPPPSAGFPVAVDSMEMAEDVKMYEALGLLSERDRLALESGQ